MRIEIVDYNGYTHAIDSADFDLIGRWFAEKSKLVMGTDCRLAYRLNVWPSTPDEAKLIPQYHQRRRFTQDDILALAEHLTNISADWPREEMTT